MIINLFLETICYLDGINTATLKIELNTIESLASEKGPMRLIFNEIKSVTVKVKVCMTNVSDCESNYNDIGELDYSNGYYGIQLPNESYLVEIHGNGLTSINYSYFAGEAYECKVTYFNTSPEFNKTFGGTTNVSFPVFQGFPVCLFSSYIYETSSLDHKYQMSSSGGLFVKVFESLKDPYYINETNEGHINESYNVLFVVDSTKKNIDNDYITIYSSESSYNYPPFEGVIFNDGFGFIKVNFISSLVSSSADLKKTIILTISGSAFILISGLFVYRCVISCREARFIRQENEATQQHLRDERPDLNYDEMSLDLNDLNANHYVRRNSDSDESSFSKSQTSGRSQNNPINPYDMSDGFPM